MRPSIPYNTKSGADGRFSIMIPALEKRRFVIGGKGYSISKSEWVTPKEDEVIELPDVQVVLYMNVLSGTLTDSAGTLLSEVRLYLNSEEAGSRETVSDRNGQFIFEHLPDGPLRLSHYNRNSLYESFSQEVEGGFHYEIVMSYIDDPDEEP